MQDKTSDWVRDGFRQVFGLTSRYDLFAERNRSSRRQRPFLDGAECSLASSPRVMLYCAWNELWTVKWTADLTERGSNSVVECQLPKLDVAGSNPVSRSIFQQLSNTHKTCHSKSLH